MEGVNDHVEENNSGATEEKEEEDDERVAEEFDGKNFELEGDVEEVPTEDSKELILNEPLVDDITELAESMGHIQKKEFTLEVDRDFDPNIS